MPTPITIETGVGSRYYTVPNAVISIADALQESLFEEVEFLRLNRLRVTCAPEIDQAQLEYRYGYLRRQGETAVAEYEPLDLNGKFIKIEIVDTVIDPDTDEPALDPITWYGIIELDAKDVDGNSTGYPSGRQSIQAFGLLRMLDLQVIKSSWVEDDGSLGGTGNTIKINTALQFNHAGRGAFTNLGNRSHDKIPITETYVFFKNPLSPDSWDAFEAIRYLLKFHAPKLADGETDANQWEFDDPDAAEPMLNWYELAVKCELRTVKQVLDELIPRQRGVSYFAYFDGETDTVKIKTFTFAIDDVTLPGSAGLPANPDQRELDFEQSFDVNAQIQDVGTSFYHRVRVYGEFMTSTFTVNLASASGMLELDWTSAEETKYLDAASKRPDGTACPDYAAADDDTKQRWNALARSADHLRNVYTRFKVSTSWDGLQPAWHDEITDEYHAFPVIGDEDAAVNPLYDATDNPEGENVWTGGLKILRHLPFMDRVDYSGDKIVTSEFRVIVDEHQPEYVPLLAYGCVEGYSSSNVRDAAGAYIDGSPRFEQLEKLNYSSFDDVTGFRWSCHIHVDDAKPAIEIRAHPAQMLAKDDFAAGSPAATNDAQDPALMNGINYQDCFATLCCEYQKRVQSSVDIAEPPDLCPARELVIYARDMRCDWVSPYTTVGLRSGKPIVNTGGGFVRDDRMFVADIARCAAEWYGTPRKTLRLEYKQVRKLFELGWLIVNIGANYSPTDIKTPITAIEYNFPPEGSEGCPTTTIETAFTALDFTD